VSDRRALPIAPRPIEGELLSSWQGRVACRYGLTGHELAIRLGAPPDGGCISRFADSDFAPAASQITEWARACRLPQESLRAMELSQGLRPQGCYVWGEGTEAGSFRRPICLACLDEDADVGGDHHIRRTWALVEILICRRHDRVLSEICPYCLSNLGWRFRSCNDAIRLVCVDCDRVVRSRHPAHAGAPCRFREALGALAIYLGDLFENKSSTTQLMHVARLLWAPPRVRNGSRTPFIAKVLPDRPPPSGETRVDRSEPLATAPLGWRMVTLIAVAQLLDLANARRDFEPLPFSLERLVEWTEGFSRPEATRQKTSPMVSESAHDRLPMRREVEYRAMAEAILASADWRNVQGQGAGARQRMLGRLMTRVLDHAPPVRGAAPGPAELSRKRPPPGGRRAAFVPASAPVAPRSRAG
jgi:hypothetical protein